MGLYFALFMAGLALGSLWASHFIKPNGDDYLLLLILFCFILISLLIVSLKELFFSNFMIPMLLFLVGSLVGISFPLGFRLYPAASKIYAADLIGAGLGGFSTSILLVPLLGFMGTATLIVGLNIINLIIFWPALLRKKQ
jgi:predicted membrane-bound spermidine synthase